MLARQAAQNNGPSRRQTTQRGGNRRSSSAFRNPAALQASRASIALRVLRDFQFDLIVQGGTGLRDGTRWEFQYVSRMRDERAKAQRRHRRNQMHDAPGTVEKKYVNRKGHADGVNRFFAAQQQSFAGFERRMTQQAAQTRPPIIGDDAIRHQGCVSRAIMRAQFT